MKLDKRKLLGPLFKPLSRLKHSQTSRILVATVCMPAQVVRGLHNKPFFAVDLVSPRGLGAVLSEAILMCNYAEHHALVPVITSSNLLYTSAPGSDFLADYLGPEPAAHARPGLTPMRFRTLWSFYHLRLSQRLPLARASEIFWRYFPPKTNVIERVDTVLSTIPGRQFDVSVHFRGTDKVLEASLVDYSVFAETFAREVACKATPTHAFLATDDVAFEAYMRRRFDAVQFTTYNLGAPSDVSRGRHFSDMSPHDKALESLVNMFLIAASPLCIRSSSYMSAVSKIINPALRTITLNQTHWGSGEFPEKELLAQEATANNQHAA